MQPNPVILDDLAARWRPLTSAEADIAPAVLNDAWARLNLLVPAVDGLVDGTPLQAVVVSLICTAVKRAMLNPEGNKTESLDDYSFTRDDSITAGDLYFTDDELALVRGATGRAMSVRFVDETC